MLYGVETSVAPNAPFTTAARGAFDFVANTYTWDSTPITLAALLDHDEWLSTGGGLDIPDDSYATLLYAPLLTFLGDSQLTVVAEVITTLVSPFFEDILHIGADSDNYWTDFSWDFGFTVEDNSNLNGDNVGDFDNAQTAGTFKAAMTRIDGHRAVCVSGNAAVINDANVTVLPVPGFPMDGFFVGGQPFGNTLGYTLLSLSIYDPVSDAILQTLSV